MMSMLATIRRHAGKLAADPVLRRWLVTSLLSGRRPGGLPRQSLPPYLALPTRWTSPAADGWQEARAPDPVRPIRLELAGRTIEVAPSGAADAFRIQHDDPEVSSALHRFAWLPLAADDDQAAGWVRLLWRHWCETYGDPSVGGLGWEAYSATERAITILDWSRRHGLPGPVESSLAILAGHGRAILNGLEYFGESGTCNHLANNGRGLFRLGLELGLPEITEAGAIILEREAARLFLESGILREGSSHYHLLYVRNWADCWLAARRHDHPLADSLERTLERLFGVLPHLTLPGGLPLIGDISPDSPPSYLAGLLPGAGMGQGWTAGLDAKQQADLAARRDGANPPAADVLAADGWRRADFGSWAGLWHVEPAGWSLPTGHGHEDLGAAEIHFHGQPLFIDPGRGAYGESGEAAWYRSAGAHGLLQVDGLDPFPVNKPYYDQGFRDRIAGPAPRLDLDAHEITLCHGGFSRLAGVGLTRRIWSFAQSSLTIHDEVAGSGSRRISRRLVTPYPVHAEGENTVFIDAPTPFRVHAEGGEVEISTIRRWVAYGRSEPATAITFTVRATLPWTGCLTVTGE